MILKPYVLLVALVVFALAGKTQPITDAQALDAGHAIETATNSGNPYPIDHFLFPDSLLENIRQKSELLKGPGNLPAFKSTFFPSFFNGKFGLQIMANTHNGNYQLLREYDDKGTKHLVFRMFGDGGLNYHDFKLVRVGDSIKAGDLYTYSFDEWTSSQIARLTDIMGASDNYKEEGAAFQKMTAQINRQDYTDAKQTYDQLPKKYQQNKFVLLLYIQACHHIDLGLYEKVLTDYSASFPDASSCYLLLLDLYYSKKEYDKALADIDKLDKVVGGDPLLNFFRGNVYALMGKNTEAIGCYEKVYAYNPTLKLNVLRLVGRYGATGQTDKGRKIIATYMDTPGYHIGDFNELYDDYPNLR